MTTERIGAQLDYNVASINLNMANLPIIFVIIHIGQLNRELDLVLIMF